MFLLLFVLQAAQDTVAPQVKPWLTRDQWAMAILTGIYVLLTGAYVLIALLTLKAIKRQARLTEEQGQSNAQQFSQQITAMNEARKQTDQLIKQAIAQVEALRLAANASQESADAARAAVETARQGVEATISKERARIKIGVGRTIPQSGQGAAGAPVKNMVECWLTNYGLTTAFVDEFRAMFLLNDSSDRQLDYSRCKVCIYAESFEPGLETRHLLLPLEPNPILSDDEVQKIRNRVLFLHVYGFARFHDVFDRRWKATVHLLWAAAEAGMDCWIPVGSTEHNQETEEK